MSRKYEPWIQTSNHHPRTCLCVLSRFQNIPSLLRLFLKTYHYPQSRWFWLQLSITRKAFVWQASVTWQRCMEVLRRWTISVLSVTQTLPSARPPCCAPALLLASSGDTGWCGVYSAGLPYKAQAAAPGVTRCLITLGYIKLISIAVVSKDWTIASGASADISSHTGDQEDVRRKVT